MTAFAGSDWSESHFGGSDWTDSHFSGSDWSESHFGCLFGGDVEVDTENLSGPVEFGFDPITLLPIVAVAGATAAFTYRGRLFGRHGHHRHHGGGGGGGASVQAAPSNMTDSDGEFEALQIAAQTDPYALGQPL